MSASRDLSPTITGATPIEALPARATELDTFGGVRVPLAIYRGYAVYDVPTDDIRWCGLRPFVRGYVEAMFHQLEEDRWCDNAGREPELMPAPGFSDLASEALVMILRDCDRWLRLYAATPSDKANGARFWELRNLQLVTRHDFPPLRAYVNDDGKVALTSQASGEGE